MPKGREISIDVLRGLGIILVIMGHICSGYGQKDLCQYIYSFHMPLFFFISGYLKYGRGTIGIKENIIKGFKKLMIPYYVLLTISILFTNTVLSYMDQGRIFAYNMPWKNILLAYILAGGYINQIPANNFPLWYLPLFYVATIIFEVFVRNKKIEEYIPAITIALIIITIPIQLLLPGKPFLHINVLPAGLAFMCMGYLTKKFVKIEGKLSYILAVAGLVLGLAISAVNGGYINQINNVVYYLGAMGTIYFLYVITKRYKDPILAYIGKNSLIIYGLHSLIFLTYPYTGIYNFFAQQFGRGILTMATQIIYTLIIGVTICYGMQQIMKIYKQRQIKQFKELEE